jgi:concentrative nucleoside transporter, CNT family
MDFVSIGRGLLGISFLIGLCYLFSNNRSRIDWKLVATGLLMQIIMAFLILKVEVVRWGFDKFSGLFLKISDFTLEGSKLVFGGLVNIPTTGYIFAVQALPTIIFFSALSSVLYYYGILQKVVYGMAWAMQKVMRISGAESMAAAANVFMGQTEAPLVIKPYLDKMSKSEILCLMVGGMATIAGGVMVAYVGMLGGDSEASRQEFATHLLAASIMSAPAAIVAAKMLYPETQEDISSDMEIPKEQIGDDVLDAIAKGTTDGVKLAVNVAAMLVVFTAFIAMANAICSATLGNISFGESTLNDFVKTSTSITDASGKTVALFDNFNIEYILGVLLSPVAWLLGTPTQDIMMVGQILGKKTILNEFVAYSDIPKIEPYISAKSKIILTYALCGFANFASIGIQIGGIGGLAPSQRKNLSDLGIKALIGGTIACFWTAAIAGMFYS